MEKRHQRLTSDYEETYRSKKISDERVIELEKSIALTKLQQTDTTRNYDSLKEEKSQVSRPLPPAGQLVSQHEIRLIWDEWAWAGRGRAGLGVGLIFNVKENGVVYAYTYWLRCNIEL